MEQNAGDAVKTSTMWVKARRRASVSSLLAVHSVSAVRSAGNKTDEDVLEAEPVEGTDADEVEAEPAAGADGDAVV